MGNVQQERSDQEEVDESYILRAGPFSGLPLRSFRCIYADPPWRFETFSDKGKGRSADQHYETMSAAAIKALPVQILAAEDCFLFLWITNPHLPLGLTVLRKWGFRYSGVAFTWAKQNADKSTWQGMGYGTRQNTETVLLGRKGSPSRAAKDVQEFLFAPRQEHSRKPDEIRNRIMRFCAGPRVELFANQRSPGWVSWGKPHRGDHVGSYGVL